jgi:hypothetical protein
MSVIKKFLSDPKNQDSIINLTTNLLKTILEQNNKVEIVVGGARFRLTNLGGRVGPLINRTPFFTISKILSIL